MTPGGRGAGIVLLAACGLLATTTLWPGAATVRTAGALALLALCPGWAVLRHARIDDLLERAVLAVAASISIVMVVAAVLMYAGWWSPGRAIAIVALLTAGAGSLERGPRAERAQGGRDVLR